MLSPLPILIYVLLLDVFGLEYEFLTFPVLLLTLYLLFGATVEEILKYLAAKINLKKC
jgi:hypothetical protein